MAGAFDSRNISSSPLRARSKGYTEREHNKDWVWPPSLFLMLNVCQELFSGFFLDKIFTFFSFDFSLGQEYDNSAPLPGAAGHTKGSLLGSLGLFRFSFLVGKNLKIILLLPVGILLAEPLLCILNGAELLAEDCFAVALLGEDVNHLVSFLSLNLTST